jgi:hypothetical protein
LNPKAEELVRAGRSAQRPTDAHRPRVFQALEPRLGGRQRPEGPEGLSTTEGLSTAGTSANVTIAKVTAAILAMGVAGAGLFVMLRTETPPATPAATAAVASPLATPERPVDPVPESAPLAVPLAQPSDEKRAPAAPRSADNLAEEVALLSQASADLHAGRPAAALAVLDEHRRKFPHGALVQERTSARVQALCALGWMSDAQAELARLSRMAPNSPHLARARKACGSGATQKD